MHRRVIPLCLALVLAAGCAKPGPRTVTGTVTLDGKALAEAHVEFVPRSDITLGSFGAQTDAEGKFTVHLGGPGLVAKAGRFVVLITKDAGIGAPLHPAGGGGEEERTKELMKKMAPGAARGSLPAVYADRETSPFEVEIQNGTTTVGPFALESKPAPR
jgi:hypothetical protein